MPLFYAAVVAGSFFYGYLRIASGSLWPASIAHAVHNSAWGLMVAFTATSSPVLVNNYLLGDSGIVITVGAALGAVLVSRMNERCSRSACCGRYGDTSSGHGHLRPSARDPPAGAASPRLRTVAL